MTLLDIDSPTYVTVAEAVEITGRSKRTLQRWISSGELGTHYGLLLEHEVLDVELLQRTRLAEGCRKPRLRNHVTP